MVLGECSVVTAGNATPAYVSPNPVGAGAAAASQGYINGCVISWLSNSQVQIAVGYLRNDQNDGDMNVSAVLTVDLSTTGANGRNVDTAEQANKWYQVNVISQPGGTLAGFAINEDDLGAFTYPPGYTRKRKVGWIRNDGGSNIRKFTSLGGGHFRKTFYTDVARASLLALNAGSATVYTTVDCSEWIPPDCVHGNFSSSLQADAPDYAEVRVTGSTVGNGSGFRIHTMPDYGINTGEWEFITDTSQQIDYRQTDNITPGDLYLYVYGWIDNLAA